MLVRGSQILKKRCIFSPMKKFAVLMPNWIGDFVMALSVVIRKASEENWACTLLVPEHLVSLSQQLCSLPVIAYRRKGKKASLECIKGIRDAGFDKLYILPHSFSSALFGFRTGVPVRRGVNAEFRRVFLTSAVADMYACRAEHLTKEYSDVLETRFLSPEQWCGNKMHYPCNGAIVLCPGAAYGPAKRWGGFEELIRFFPERDIFILGDKRDAEDTEHIHSDQRIHNLAGKTTLQEAVSILASAAVVISNDSGLMHIAGFSGVPVVGIYGSTTPNWTRPLGSSVRIASSGYGCSPCFERTCRKKDYGCLTDITPATVCKLALEIAR